MEDLIRCYDIESFIFYPLFECDQHGAHFCGFFSKNINNPDQVLWDIMVLPIYHKRSFSLLMISISYELARRSGVPGYLRCPMDPKNLIVFQYFWRTTIANAVRSGIVDPDVIAMTTGIGEEDVWDVLEELDCLRDDGEKKMVDPMALPLMDSRVNQPFQKGMLIWAPEKVTREGD